MLLNPIKISYKNLTSSKFRSFLTILGIIIGTAAVIIIMAIGASAQLLLIEQVQGVGSNLIAVLPGGGSEEGPPPAILGISITTLTYDDLLALRKTKNVPEAETAAGYVLGTATVSFDGKDVNQSFIGTTASFIDVENNKIQDGRFFFEEEERNLARVAVLGPKTARELFGDQDPVNKRVKVNDISFTVVGVLDEKGSQAFGVPSYDESVFLPLKSAQKLILGVNHLGFVRMKIKDSHLVDSGIENVKLTLRERHDISDPDNDDFTIRSQEMALEMVDDITDVLRYFLLVIGSISLVVGGVGIMNIMLIAVNQRIREIGLRKAVGAKNKDVAMQFLVESAFISLAGGVIGIIIGLVVSYLISLAVQYFGYDWKFLVSVEAIITATSVSILIGLVFGIYPARKAMKISPIEALRYE